MKQTWQDWEEAAKRGPVTIAVKAILAVAVLGILVSVIGYSLGWFTVSASQGVKNASRQRSSRIRQQQ